MFVLLNRNSYKEGKMEDQLLVAKTLLKCYPHLDDLFRVLHRCSEECVESGFYALFPNEQMRLYERICAYEKRKLGVYNMKYLIEESFRRGKGSALSLLKERFLYNRDMNELMEKYGVSLRTCYRYLKRGLREFADALASQGFDKKRILCEYGNEPLFQTMLNRVIKEDDLEREKEIEKQREETSINTHPLPPLCRLCRESAFSEGGRALRG